MIIARARELVDPDEPDAERDSKPHHDHEERRKR
jgi:hypothetical protein